jgi:hypothetical protein
VLCTRSHQSVLRDCDLGHSNEERIGEINRELSMLAPAANDDTLTLTEEVASCGRGLHRHRLDQLRVIVLTSIHSRADRPRQQEVVGVLL